MVHGSTVVTCHNKWDLGDDCFGLLYHYHSYRVADTIAPVHKQRSVDSDRKIHKQPGFLQYIRCIADCVVIASIYFLSTDVINLANL